MRATVICPTHSHGRLIHYALRCVLRQTHQDFEVFIIGDGVTEETRAAVNEVLKWDSRLQFFDFAKSPRHGEMYRHELLLTKAKGEMVCYIADDDLWLPYHLQMMNDVLLNHDMAHSRLASIGRNGSFTSGFANWQASAWQQWMFELPRRNAMGLSQVGHRMDFYQKLPFGWRTTPPEEWSDHYMWKQMLSVPDVKAGATGDPSAVQFPSPLRKDMSLDERLVELQIWEDRINKDYWAVRDKLLSKTAKWEAEQLKHGHPEELYNQLCHAQEFIELLKDSEAQKNREIDGLRSQESKLNRKLEEAKYKREQLAAELERIPKWMRSLAKRIKPAHKAK